jgi:hypothetical protein
LKTATIILILPESLIVHPRPDNLLPTPTDELRLRLLGIAQCTDSARDTGIFLSVLHWLAEKEAAYEPQPASETDMPRVASTEFAERLVKLTESDPLTLRRLYEMLRLDNTTI